VQLQAKPELIRKNKIVNRVPNPGPAEYNISESQKHKKGFSFGSSDRSSVDNKNVFLGPGHYENLTKSKVI